MKNALILLLCILPLLSLSACQGDKPTYQEPVQVYYRTAVDDDHIPESVLGAITMEAAPYEGDLQGLLNAYLKGTGAEGFGPTFPSSTKVLSLEIADGTAKLQLNSAISRLSGADLTIACACLARTTMELSGVTTVSIRASDSMLNGVEEIVMTADNLILRDQKIPQYN